MTATIYGGMLLPQNFLKMMRLSLLRFVLKMVPNDTVSTFPSIEHKMLIQNIVILLVYLEFRVLLISSFQLNIGIGRTLIPRYFRSIFEGGVTDLRYDLRHPKESFHNTTITLDCDQCTVVTLHGKPMFTKVSKSKIC